ncbi:endonuclease VII domain-containing protein [Streptomyces flavofungini]|uniref:endonuclease VII domain-containing protein n=1 Tax=Streptomyces flavofungini TaxID=68200 RepID=UPI0025AF8864|nr:endonuclease VII domain-containing protein [Streptomyces flavofungini]WJV49930.1 endonuclease VII domain-containing protein [Streptomyces flavofungini]
MSPPKKGYRKCSRCDRNRAERFYTPRGRICLDCRRARQRKSARDARVHRTYGLSVDDYAQIFKFQDGRCAICRETRRTNLAVDHCHKTNAVRGLLCARCNSTLLARGARDRVDVLRRAADYLEKYPAWEALGEPRYTPETGRNDG